MTTLIPLEAPLLTALQFDVPGAACAMAGNGEELAPLLAHVAEATAAMQQKTGAVAPWIGYLARAGAGTVVGTCAFKAPPDDGGVEIAYFTFPGHEHQGHGRMMAEALLDIAFAHPDIERVCAHTAPSEGPSTAILRRLRFSMTGEIDDPTDGRIWRWVRTREAS